MCALFEDLIVVNIKTEFFQYKYYFISNNLINKIIRFIKQFIKYTKYINKFFKP